MVELVLYFSIWLHVLSAITWFGAVLAMEFIVFPSFENKLVPESVSILRPLTKRSAKISELASGLILITGLYQTYATGYFSLSKLLGSLTGNLILLKVILFIVFAGLAEVAAVKVTKLSQTVSTEVLHKAIAKAKNLLLIDVFVGLAIVLIAIYIQFNI